MKAKIYTDYYSLNLKKLAVGRELRAIWTLIGGSTSIVLSILSPVCLFRAPLARRSTFKALSLGYYSHNITFKILHYYYTICSLNTLKL